VLRIARTCGFVESPAVLSVAASDTFKVITMAVRLSQNEIVDAIYWTLSKSAVADKLKARWAFAVG
jgi:hypothetical protein